MATTILEDGIPYLPEPDEERFPGLDTDEAIRAYLRSLVRSLREYFITQKIDMDSLATPGLAGTKVYYVSDSSGGAVTRKLTFTDGILTSET